jgi:hypothetical protein
MSNVTVRTTQNGHLYVSVKNLDNNGYRKWVAVRAIARKLGLPSRTVYANVHRSQLKNGAFVYLYNPKSR